MIVLLQDVSHVVTWIASVQIRMMLSAYDDVVVELQRSDVDRVSRDIGYIETSNLSTKKRGVGSQMALV
jgi:hypothetical protein